MHPPSPPRCADCGYDLTGVPIVEHRITCPECGGGRVRVPRWDEPKLPWRTASLYLPAAAALALPGAAIAAAADLGDARALARWLLFSGPPFVWLGLILAVWRPGLHAGVCALGLAAVLAYALGGIAWLATLFPSHASLAIVVPLAIAYYLLPAPLGILWAHAVLDDTPEREGRL